jgi:hypothetical protein
MRLTATEFRKDLFKVLDQATKGETVEVVYKGATLHVSATDTHSKLARAKRQHSLVSDPDSIVHTDKKLMAALESKWRKEHSRL